MAIEKVVKVVVEVKYSMADNSSAEGICQKSMVENIENELGNLRVSGMLTPVDICATELTCELLDSHTNP